MHYSKLQEKKVLIIIPNLGRGGAQQVFRDQVVFFRQYFDVIPCVFNLGEAFPDDKALGLVSLGVPAGKNLLSKAYFFLKRIIKLRQIKRKYNVDFAISHLEGADYVNLLSRQNEKVICWIHGSKSFDQNIEGGMGWLRKKILIPLTYKRSGLLITVSEGIREELIRDFSVSSNQVKTIYNGFDIEEIALKAKQNVDVFWEELFTDKTVLITHCRLSRQKNLPALIDIFSSLKSGSKVKLMILGDGELRSSIVEYCKSFDLLVYEAWNATPLHQNYDVYFLGYERNPYPYLHRASLYIMTSLWEGFPLALCEAMTCGVPVITADCYTGPREIITPELKTEQPVREPVFSPYGVLMPLPNSKETIGTWVQTINHVMEDENLRRKQVKNGSMRIHNFDKREITSQWLKLLQ